MLEANGWLNYLDIIYYSIFYSAMTYFLIGAYRKIETLKLEIQQGESDFQSELNSSIDKVREEFLQANQQAALFSQEEREELFRQQNESAKKNNDAIGFIDREMHKARDQSDQNLSGIRKKIEIRDFILWELIGRLDWQEESPRGVLLTHERTVFNWFELIRQDLRIFKNNVSFNADELDTELEEIFHELYFHGLTVQEYNDTYPE